MLIHKVSDHASLCTATAYMVSLRKFEILSQPSNIDLDLSDLNDDLTTTCTTFNQSEQWGQDVKLRALTTVPFTVLKARIYSQHLAFDWNR